MATKGKVLETDIEAKSVTVRLDYLVTDSYCRSVEPRLKKIANEVRRNTTELHGTQTYIATILDEGVEGVKAWRIERIQFMTMEEAKNYGK